MGLFDALVRTVVNVATIPVAVAKDVVTLGGATEDEKRSYTEKKLGQIKREASIDDDWDDE